MRLTPFLKKFLFPTVIGLVFIYFLFTLIDLKESYDHFIGIKPYPFFMAFLLYVVQYLMLALRWKILVKAEIGIAPLFAVTSIHNMTNNIMPFRTGEATFPYLMKRYYNVGLGDSTAYLIYARVFDLLAIMVFFFVSLIFSYDSVLETFRGLERESLKFLTYLVILISIVFILYRIIDGISKSGVEGGGVVPVGLKKGFQSLMRGMKSVEVLKIFSKLSISSLAIFLARYTFFMFALATFGVDLPFYKVITAATMAILAAVFPVQGAGGFGTIETGWVMGFILIGVDKELALMAGLGTHMLRLIFSLIFAAIAFPMLESGRKSDVR